MAWQILAIWALVMASIAWFVRDERRLIANASMAQAAFLYPPSSHGDDADEDNAAAPQTGRRAGLSSVEREFLQALSDTP